MTNYESNILLIDDARDAFSTIDRLTNCDCTDSIPRRRNCIHFAASTALRDLLIDRDDEPDHSPTDPFSDDPAIFDFLRALLARIDAAPYQTDRISAMLLDNSLCPMHAIDYAICFDDDTAECATLRAYFPSHDT